MDKCVFDYDCNLSVNLVLQVLDGISDIRDESDRSGMRIVIEVLPTASRTCLKYKFNLNLVKIVLFSKSFEVRY